MLDKNIEESPDLIILNLQEIVDFSVLNVVVGHNDDLKSYWTSSLLTYINKNIGSYIAVSQHDMVGCYISVFSKLTIAHKINSIENIDQIKCGFAGLMGDKGGLILKFKFEDLQLCFLNCHLQAHTKNIQERRDGLLKIHQKAINPISNKISKSAQFLVGDLNFRTQLKYQEMLDLISAYRLEQAQENLQNQQKLISQMLKTDQLLSINKYDPILKFYQEGQIDFLPTYKFDNGTQQYDTSKKRRTPAWCDRILYQMNSIDIHQKNYKSIEYYTESDHKPVSSLFIINYEQKKINPKYNLSKQLLIQQIEKNFEIQNTKSRDGDFFRQNCQNILSGNQTFDYFKPSSKLHKCKIIGSVLLKRGLSRKQRYAEIVNNRFLYYCLKDNKQKIETQYSKELKELNEYIFEFESENNKIIFLDKKGLFCLDFETSQQDFVLWKFVLQKINKKNREQLESEQEYNSEPQQIQQLQDNFSSASPYQNLYQLQKQELKIYKKQKYYYQLCNLYDNIQQEIQQTYSKIIELDTILCQSNTNDSIDIQKIQQQKQNIEDYKHFLDINSQNLAKKCNNIQTQIIKMSAKSIRQNSIKYPPSPSIEGTLFILDQQRNRVLKITQKIFSVQEKQNNVQKYYQQFYSQFLKSHKDGNQVQEILIKMFICLKLITKYNIKIYKLSKENHVFQESIVRLKKKLIDNGMYCPNTPYNIQINQAYQNQNQYQQKQKSSFLSKNDDNLSQNSRHSQIKNQIIEQVNLPQLFFKQQQEEIFNRPKKRSKTQKIKQYSHTPSNRNSNNITLQKQSNFAKTLKLQNKCSTIQFQLQSQDHHITNKDKDSFSNLSSASKTYDLQNQDQLEDQEFFEPKKTRKTVKKSTFNFQNQEQKKRLSGSVSKQIINFSQVVENQKFPQQIEQQLQKIENTNNQQIKQQTQESFNDLKNINVDTQNQLIIFDTCQDINSEDQITENKKNQNAGTLSLISQNSQESDIIQDQEYNKLIKINKNKKRKGTFNIYQHFSNKLQHLDLWDDHRKTKYKLSEDPSLKDLQEFSKNYEHYMKYINKDKRNQQYLGEEQIQPLKQLSISSKKTIQESYIKKTSQSKVQVQQYKENSNISLLDSLNYQSNFNKNQDIYNQELQQQYPQVTSNTYRFNNNEQNHLNNEINIKKGLENSDLSNSNSKSNSFQTIDYQNLNLKKQNLNENQILNQSLNNKNDYIQNERSQDNFNNNQIQQINNLNNQNNQQQYFQSSNQNLKTYNQQDYINTQQKNLNTNQSSNYPDINNVKQTSQFVNLFNSNNTVNQNLSQEKQIPIKDLIEIDQIPSLPTQFKPYKQNQNQIHIQVNKPQNLSKYQLSQEQIVQNLYKNNINNNQSEDQNININNQNINNINDDNDSEIKNRETINNDFVTFETKQNFQQNEPILKKKFIKNQNQIYIYITKL